MLSGRKKRRKMFITLSTKTTYHRRCWHDLLDVLAHKSHVSANMDWNSRCCCCLWNLAYDDFVRWISNHCMNHSCCLTSVLCKIEIDGEKTHLWMHFNMLLFSMAHHSWNYRIVCDNNFCETEKFLNNFFGRCRLLFFITFACMHFMLVRFSKLCGVAERPTWK